MTIRCSIAIAAACAALTMIAPGAATSQELASECEYAPNGPSHIAVGVVECLRIDSAMMGGKMPFTYYVPPVCAPTLGRECPVLYLLHGLNGTYASMLGPNADYETYHGFIEALTSGPPVDPRTIADPWSYESESTWVAKPPLDFILVAPHGATLVDGHNPRPGQTVSTGWQDYNPRYFEGGDKQTFVGPPPRNASHVIQELLPYIERHFPANASRAGRALAGISYGGIGTGNLGLRWPDLFSSLHQISGMGLAWPPACGVDPAGNEVAMPLEGPPEFVIDHPAAFPLIESLVAPPVISFAQGGDWLTVDYSYTRQHHPPDLMVNARAFRNGEQVIRWAFSANDSVSRRVEDGAGAAVGAALEHLVATETANFADQEAQLRSVPHIFEFHPGLHSGPYWRPYYRVWLEAMYAGVQHWDGGGNVFPPPDVFDYRTVFKDFEVWGWKFSIARGVDEFINLTDVSCQSLTLRGTGAVTVIVPASCGTGVNGSRVVTVDLGPSIPMNESAALGLCESYGHTETVALTLPEPAFGGLLAGVALVVALRIRRAHERKTH